jgi:membrane-bound serine protease (ClpP class)
MLVNVLRRIRLFMFFIFWLSGFALLSMNPARAQPLPGAIHILEIEGIINPPSANYLERALQDAVEQEASLIVIMMDTPGGLDTSMRRITQAILASPVPVVVYVAPPGARAASAGLFVLIASHVAAMAPGTNTGAAHPVGLGGDQEDVAATKAVEDAAATIRSLAIQQGRNAEWAERAVRESVSVTSNEALELNVIDLVAQNLDQLISEIQGMTLETTAGEITLDVVNAPRHSAPMTFSENFLHVISDPNIAFILLSVGSIGLIAELYNPGSLIPGITGIIALILAFFSLGNLPTNWAGVALLTLGIILFIAEISTEGIGFLGVGALVAFLLGGLMLFQPFRPASPAWPDLSVNPWLVGSTTAIMGGFMLVVMAQLIRSRRSPIKTGFENFIGQTATVHQELNPTGRVWFQGQTWYAELASDKTAVPTGEKVRIRSVKGLTLIVEPLEDREVTLQNENPQTSS